MNRPRTVCSILATTVMHHSIDDETLTRLVDVGRSLLSELDLDVARTGPGGGA
jgi:hypothetical protein